MTTQTATCRYCLHPIERSSSDAWWHDPDGYVTCTTGAYTHQPIPRTIRDE
jgi:hypothetical protein